MRTTLDIEADVLMAAKEIAAKEKTSAGAVLSRLARTALTGAREASGPAPLRNGVPAIAGTGHIVMMGHVRSLLDEEGL